MNLYEAIFVRKSVRNYCFDTLPPQTLDKIWEHYKEMPALFSGIGVDMAILDNRKGQERMLSMFSVKAPYYMAFYSEESERYLMNVGYIMEQMVLYLCSIGLGTCFIGSNRVKKAELEKNGKRLVGIVAFGKSHGSHTRRQSEAKRLPLEDLCVFKEVPRQWMTQMLEAARPVSYTHLLILCLQELIDNDPEVSPYFKVIMLENYNVSKAAKVIPAADISEQISLASKEASGTGNMKFMLNGALTLGTEDGANVEIGDLVGKENIYIFGKKPQDVIDLYADAAYCSKDIYDENPEIAKLVDFIVSDELLAIGDKVCLERLYKEILNKDWFMTLLDLKEYIKTKERVYKDYENKDAWNKKCLINIAKAGFFSSDRTIAQYNEDIWHLA